MEYPEPARKVTGTHEKRRRWRRAVSVLACAVVFCTTYALILPAITLSAEPKCGLEEHTHTEDCYETRLVCGQAEDPETDPAGSQEAAGPAHVHTDACYEQVLTCEKPEHTHTDACYAEPEPLCGLAEHQHGDDCYDPDGQLTCELPEHSHSEDCYTAPETPEEPTEEPEETDTLSPEEQLAAETRFTQAVEAQEAQPDLDAVEALMEELRTAHLDGELPDEVYVDLYLRLQALTYGDDPCVAETSDGRNWLLLQDSGWFEEYSAYGGAETYALDSAAAPLANDVSGSGQQVNDAGGTNTNESDGVSVSKTIAGTDLENVFDITLQVTTPQTITEVIEEPDMAVVIVMDISNTMNDPFPKGQSETTRYTAAMAAAEDFLDKFAESNSLGVSKIGYVAFNTDAHQIFDLQSCTDQDQANALKNTMRTETGKIIGADGYKDSHSRFTNVEAGLKLGWDMLKNTTNKNKYIIFLSDGFPTTYISSGYNGYDPYDSAGARFKDRVLNKPCSYGTSYSDEAAIRARNMANNIKGQGIKIFSIGVDVGGQTIQKYITQSEEADGFSVVDRIGTRYEIGDASSEESYKTWLKNSIGSGYYYDSTDTAGLKAAYDQIFAEIKRTIAESAKADWVASDPIPMGQEATEVIEFIHFWTQGSQPAQSLSGENALGAENTASLQQDTGQQPTIRWDLKNSGYTEKKSGNTTTYTYTLRYRVRLENEAGSFVENQVYNTNGTTSLTYRVVKNDNGNITVSDTTTIKFPIPSVHGYLGELTFTKVDNRGNPLAGAEFTLTHDWKCTECHGDGTAVTVPSQVATSDSNGTVTFKNIPSGHTYTLTETGIPPGYSGNGCTYQVTVAYDKVTVTVTNVSGETVPWDGTIVNNTYYELPSTGGGGTVWFTFAGILLMTGAAALTILRRRAKEGGPE